MIGDELSLITLNTWKCDGDYPRRLQLMSRELSALAPDILCLQEAFVDESGAHDTARFLAQTLGLECCFAPARHGQREFGGRMAGSWSGMALLSRLPVLAHEALPLPTHPKDGDRVAQLAVLQWGEERLLVINVHLTYLKAEDEVRCAQLANVLRHPWLAEDYAAIFLCGDFNDAPEGVLLEWLRERRGWRVLDCMEGRGERHSTLKGDATAGSPLGPNYDYVLLLEHLRPSRVELLGADYVLNAPDADSGLYPSDHFGVRVRFRKEGAP